MAFRVEYFRAGKKIGTDPCPISLEDATKSAQTGLIMHNADLARIRDMGNNGKEVGLVKR
jgi:hypothetical protein